MVVAEPVPLLRRTIRPTSLIPIDMGHIVIDGRPPIDAPVQVRQRRKGHFIVFEHIVIGNNPLGFAIQKPVTSHQQHDGQGY